MNPSLFDLKMGNTHDVKLKWPVPTSLRVHNKGTDLLPVKMNQFPVVRNTATTGHKLQGKTVPSIFIYDWQYVTNWPYVVLSRVETMDGVYLRKPLSEDVQHYTVPDELLQMIDRLAPFQPDYLDLDDYMDVATGNYTAEVRALMAPAEC